jgi:6-phosphogluconolactonase
VASLFPGHPALDASDVAVAVTDSPKPPPERVSLTLPTLNRSRVTWLVVSGSAKADAVAQALAGADLPAAKVHGTEETVWFLDREAASSL